MGRVVVRPDNSDVMAGQVGREGSFRDEYLDFPAAMCAPERDILPGDHDDTPVPEARRWIRIGSREGRGGGPAGRTPRRPSSRVISTRASGPVPG